MAWPAVVENSTKATQAFFEAIFAQADAMPEKELGVVNGGAATKLDCKAFPRGLYVCELQASSTFEFTNIPGENAVEIGLEWKVTTEFALPTFTYPSGTIYWINGPEPAWNETLNARNIAFFIVRKASTKLILGEA